MPIAVTITDKWSDGKRVTVIGTLAFSGSYVVGGDTIDFAAAGVESAYPPLMLDVPDYRTFEFAPDFSGGKATNVRLVTSLYTAQAATGTITSNGTNVSNNDTVTVGATTYTFKTTLTPAAGEVLRGATAAASLQNLVDAINGTPGLGNVTYGTGAGAPNATEFATLSGLVITVVARHGGTGANADALAKVAATLTVSGAALAGGAAVSTNPGELAAGAYPADIKVLAVPFTAYFKQLM